MILRCPVCRAENTSGPTCRRCRADLSLLAAVEARRDSHLTRARAAIHDRQFDVALNELADAERLRFGPDIRQLRAVSFLIAGDFSSALAEHGTAAH
jgi:hypothetical protein